MPEFLHVSELPHPPEVVFDWHARDGAFDRLTPPWEDVRVVSRSGGLDVGARLELSAPVLGPFRSSWVAEHTWCERPTGFTDVQTQGPFAKWEHEHRFEKTDVGTRLKDRILWEPPLGPIGDLAAPTVIVPRLEKMFAFRHQRVARDLARHAEADSPPLRIAMTGATGLVGRQLTAFLQTGGHTVIPMTRHRDQPGIHWDPMGGTVGPGLEDCDAVIHLAGAPISDGPWTDEAKRRIHDSREVGTRTLCEALAKLPPKVLISTSAIGVYGDRGDTELDEHSEPGTGFLAEVAQAWEASTEAARQAGWRVAIIRVGLVISARGGLLGPLLPLYRTGTGGPLGSGDQQMSWVHIDDLIGLYHYALTHPVEGVYNGTGPQPVSNREFAHALGAALGRPAIVPAPAFAVRMALGREKADELVLASQRALPTRAIDEGFRFDCPTLESALAFEL